MRKLSLFSGIGGIDLAAKWAGMETVAFCEWEKFPQQVLKKNFPGIPVYGDVRDLTKERLEQDGIIGSDRAIDIISAGYPCQPFSYAGQRRGAEDDRHLWPEVFRLIQEIKPKWFVGENVAGHISLGLDIVLADLESIGYEWETFVLPASSVGAKHKRNRVFILAHTCSVRWQEYNTASITEELGQRARGSFEKIISDSNSESRLQTDSSVSSIRRIRRSRDDVGRSNRIHVPRTYWDVFESPAFGVAHGLPDHMDRVKALGNAVVPDQVFPLLAAIKAIHDQL